MSPLILFSFKKPKSESKFIVLSPSSPLVAHLHPLLCLYNATHQPQTPNSMAAVLTKEKSNYMKNKTARWKQTRLVAAFFSFWLLLIYLRFQRSVCPNQTLIIPIDTDHIDIPTPPWVASSAACTAGAYVYVYDLPPQFNSDLLRDCRHLNIYTDMCPYVTNRGLGRPMPGLGKPWFATHQFIGEMIFHARMENHPCRTTDPTRADLFYVPFYGGLYASSKFRDPDLAQRDALAVELVEYLGGSTWWRRNGGRDHFLVLGRTSWDFMRLSNSGPDFGANSLLDLPRIQNMSVLTVERQPWRGGPNQQGIPYSTYFHPSTLDELLSWQYRTAHSARPFLFSFIGGKRKGPGKAAIRDDLISQCSKSTTCQLMKCGASSKCHEPDALLQVMMSSRFCLQAPGDSFTRRSTFDAILSGCIPVFFSRHMAYTQYMWFLPDDRDSYSVFVDTPEGGPVTTDIEKLLSDISNATVEKMRSKVIELIPSITYAHPNATNPGFNDTVDVTLEALSKSTKLVRSI